MLLSAEGIRQFFQTLFDSEKCENPTLRQDALRNYLDFRKDSITGFVRQAARLSRKHGWEVGLDCFSPTLAYSVGQDLKELDKLTDWIKVMTYMHTFAPAGMPFELNGVLDFITGKSRPGMDSAMKWLSQITHLPLPPDQETLIKNGLSSACLSEELQKGIRTVPGKLLAGIELVAIKGITKINPPRLEKDMQVLKQVNPRGIVLSWDLWKIPEEYLRIISIVFSSP